MKMTVVAVLLALAAAPAAAQQAPQPPDKVTAPGQPSQPSQMSEARFLSTVSVSGQYEVQSSELVLQESRNPDIRQFAQHMIQDHTKANEELRSLTHTPATTSSLQSPPGATKDVKQNPALDAAHALDPTHMEMLNQLRRAKGDDLDRLYALQQLQEHQQAVKLFQDYAQSGQEAQLRQFAQNTLPVLEQHLEMAKKLPQH